MYRYIATLSVLLLLTLLGISLGESFINIFNISPIEIKLIYHLRLPRIIYAILTGMGLGICGVSMQALTKNPMASPFTLGVSSAAAFGAAISIIFLGNSRVFIIIGAFIASIVCAFIVYLFSLKKKMTSITIIIIGISLNYLFSALTSTLQYLTSEEKLSSIVNWTFGSLSNVLWINIYITSFILLFTFVLLYKKVWILNLMCNTSDEYATTLGVNIEKERIIIGVITIAVTASIISVTGIIGFVGLVSPYISKKIVGNNYKTLLPYSALVGSCLVLSSDILGRTLFSPMIIPIGIIMSYIGVPILINLILKREV